MMLIVELERNVILQWDSVISNARMLLNAGTLKIVKVDYVLHAVAVILTLIVMLVKFAIRLLGRVFSIMTLHPA